MDAIKELNRILLKADSDEAAVITAAIAEIERLNKAISTYLEWFDNSEDPAPEEEMLGLLRAAVKSSDNEGAKSND